MISVDQLFPASVLVDRVIRMILVVIILFAGIYLESTRSRPRTSGGRRVLVVGWLLRFLAVGPAIGFWWLAVGFVLHSEVNLTAVVGFAVTLVFTTLLAADMLIRRVIYSSEGITLVSLLRPRRGITLQWCDVHEIDFDFDKAKILTSRGQYVIHTIAMRGATDFEAFARSIMEQKDTGQEELGC